ncbi:MAG: aminotransferase class I/II-fold pyridoxal phosphate-dependent enzyme [Dehalococcoidia bacterium]|nr:aminotransferase class I/II-fold pyridoxal phosphate-dependent enzyme [Dehalococcoidia bacterium]
MVGRLDEAAPAWLRDYPLPGIADAEAELAEARVRLEEAAAEALRGRPGPLEFRARFDGRKVTTELCMAQVAEVEVDPERVIVTSGSSPAMLLLFAALLDPGDEVILSNPCYACYPNIVEFVDGVPVEVPVFEEEGFQYRPRDIERRLGSRTRAVIINSPSNPTGNLLEPEVMEEIAALAERGLYVVSDEIYHGLVYERKEHSILEFTDRAFVINGFSKLYAMTGWRLGYLIAPEEFVRPIQKMQQNLFISANSFVQRGGIAYPVVPVRPRVLHDPAATLGGQAHLVGARMDAVGEDRSRRQRAERGQPRDRSGVATRPGVGDVGGTLGHVHMQHGAELAAEPAGFADRLVGHRERRVQPDGALHEGPVVRRDEAAALFEASPRLVAAAVPLGRAVAEQRAHPELLAGVGEHVEGALDEAGRLVMVDDRGRAGHERLGHVQARRGPQARPVEGAVEPPPDAFENLDEADRGRVWRGHAEADEAAVEVRVSVGETGQRHAKGHPHAAGHPVSALTTEIPGPGGREGRSATRMSRGCRRAISTRAVIPLAGFRSRAVRP